MIGYDFILVGVTGLCCDVIHKSPTHKSRWMQPVLVCKTSCGKKWVATLVSRERTPEPAGLSNISTLKTVTGIALFVVLEGHCLMDLSLTRPSADNTRFFEKTYTYRLAARETTKQQNHHTINERYVQYDYDKV